MSSAEVTYVPYRVARRQIADSDLLLFRRRGLISIAGRGNHSHAAKAAWWKGDLFVLEIREWHGGRAVTLYSQVQRHPGRIDVYETNPEERWPQYDREQATRYMRRLAGCGYGYCGVLAASLLHLPLARLFAHADLHDDEPSMRPPFCSQACAMSDRIGGGVDPVTHLADRMTLPADLARSVTTRVIRQRPLRPWQPKRWNDVPPRATALENVEDRLYSADEAALLLEGFNNCVLDDIRSIWAVAVQVSVRYEGDARAGAPVTGYAFPAASPE